jgi:UDP-N-acetylmuramoyl-L-alanyl-D-glutamate--2,6-diaminopimelate ligase
MVAQGLDYAVAEVSSHALDQGRVKEVDFSAAVFTNLAPEHLDYHPSLEDYLRAKASLFRGLSSHSFACINIDDEAADSIMKGIKAKVITFGLKREADISASIERMSLSATEFLLRTPSGNVTVKWGFLGRHNVYNALAAAACAQGLALDVEAIGAGLEAAEPVPGRLEKVDCGQDFTVLVDYAHTDHALRAVLSMLKGIAPGRILLVFGCGGDRDRAKRPRMGRVAAELTDYFWLTNDNPRTEGPLHIIKDISRGINSKASYAIEPERRRAILAALAAARAGDVVLIAGKGHEKRQIFKDKTVAFDDFQVAREILSQKS